MRNKYDNSDCLEKGLSAEQAFVKCAAGKGFLTKSSSKDENINEHIDFWIKKDEDTYSVDVKAAKRLFRNDKDVVYDKLWIELHSVRANNRGWLLDGKADFIAFEQYGHFLVTNRLWLIDFIRANVNPVVVPSPLDALYKIYSREGREDMLTIIETNDILNISKIWYK